MSYDFSKEAYSVHYDEIEKTTAQAWLIRFDDGRAHWFPKSLCAISHKEGPGALTAPAWLLDEKEVNYDV